MQMHFVTLQQPKPGKHDPLVTYSYDATQACALLLATATGNRACLIAFPAKLRFTVETYL
jgi:hypothetical protein